MLCLGEGSCWSLQGNQESQSKALWGLLHGPAPAGLWDLGIDSVIWVIQHLHPAQATLLLQKAQPWAWKRFSWPLSSLKPKAGGV